MTADDATDPLLERLRGDAPGDDAWAAARARFGERAAAEALVDVAFEDHDTPIGRLRLAATDAGIVRVMLASEDHDGGLEDLARRVSPRVLRARTAAIGDARGELDEYFAGARRAFDVPLDWRLTTPFRREVLRATARIPYGDTSSYLGVATAAGSPKAVRAAGTALATNPIPILVPCHRVLRTDGALGQYRGGVEAKTRLLELEGALAA